MTTRADWETCGDCSRAFDPGLSGYEDVSKCGRCWDKINMAEGDDQ